MFWNCIKKREKVILGRIYEKFKTYIRYFKVSIDKQEKKSLAQIAMILKISQNNYGFVISANNYFYNFLKKERL